MNRKERNTQTFATKTKKTNRKSGLYIVRKCAENIPQMVKWDTPNGGLGYEETGFQASEHGCRGGVLGGQGLRNGGYEASLYAQNWVKQEKRTIHFCNFLGMENGIIIR